MDADNAARLDHYLRARDRMGDLILDAWDVTACDAAGVAVIRAAKQRADDTGWGFALLAEPDGPCDKALDADPNGRTVQRFANRHVARAALYTPA